MTFDAQERSRELGAPIELYTFAVGPDVFRITSAEDEIAFGGNTYTPRIVSRSSIVINPQNRAQLLTVELPSDDEFSAKYINIVPGFRATLTIQRLHRFDSPAFTDAETIFKGIVRSVAYTNDGFKSKISIIPIDGAMKRSIPRFTYQGLCNHVLFDNRCKVLETSFRYQGNVSVVSGKTITVDGLNAAKGAGWAVGGFVTLPSGDFRLILEQATDVLTLLLPFVDETLVLNQTVSVFAGCDHTIQVCKSKFNNVVNYGGFAFVPLRNVFESGID